MKFSLSDLIALMLFVALITNAVILNGKYNKSRIAKEKLSSGPAVKSMLERDVDQMQKQVDEGVDRNAQLLSIKERLVAEFETFAASTFMLKVLPDQLSVIGIPEFSEHRYQRSFLIHNPENQIAELKVYFQKASSMSPGEDPGAFASIDEQYLEFPAGEFKLTFRFEHSSDEVGFAKVLVDEKEIYCNEFSGPCKGNSSSLFQFDKQRDYKTIGKPVPLIRYQPSSSQKKIRVDIVRKNSQ